jgi:hypothetical protein
VDGVVDDAEVLVWVADVLLARVADDKVAEVEREAGAEELLRMLLAVADVLYTVLGRGEDEDCEAAELDRADEEAG